MTRSAAPSAFLLLSMLLASLAGCESTPRAGDLDQALSDYEAGRYALAHSRATEAISGATGSDRQNAAYLAGLSAYRLGKLDEAERRLMTASQSTDSATKANAHAMLGLIRMDQRRPREAAGFFTSASAGLKGEDARQAARFAADAYEQAGDARSAQHWSAIAKRRAASPGSATDVFATFAL